MKKIRTWLQVYDRLGRQPFCKTKNLRIFLKKDGKKIPLHLVYNEYGSEWWLEEDINDDKVMD